MTRLLVQLRIAIARKDRVAELCLRARLGEHRPWNPADNDYAVFVAPLLRRAA